MLHATINQIPPDHPGVYVLESNGLQVEADDYDTAPTAVEARVPGGWRLIALRVDHVPERGTRA